VRFHANRDVFSDAVSFAVRLLPQRTTLPILSGVLIETTDDGLSLSSFDYEVSARVRIDAQVEEPGRVLVSGRLLADIANRLPGVPVEVSTQENRVLVSAGSAKFTLLSMPVAEYPSLPAVGEPTGVVPSGTFSGAIAQVVVAASRDDVTPVITGVQLEAGPSTISLTATDRYRVAVRELPWQGGDGEATSALVPARTLQEVGRTFANAGDVGIGITRGGDRELISFSADRRTVTSLLIKGNFPPVKRLFPDTSEHFAVIGTAELVEATRRVQLVLEREAALRYSFSSEGLTLEAAGSEQAQASEQLDAVLEGDDIVVSLKPQFLLDGLSGVHTEFVRISFTKTENPNKPGPVLISGQKSKDEAGGTEFRYLLQPNLLLR
jgi:DNA polymerase III subunit beta